MLDCNNRIVLRYLTEKKFRFLRHGLFLIGLLILFANANTNAQFLGNYKTYFSLALWTVFVAMFYINMYVLIPQFFFRGKYEIYTVLLILLVTASLLVVMQIAIYIFSIHIPAIERQRTNTMSFVSGLFICVPIILTTTTFKLFKRWIEDNKRISDLKNLALTTELNALKNQIQPHFLFNMLNNVKALIRKNPSMATEVIIKLSDFLRYQLYENDADKTLLKSEINFIFNFLKLEEIRRDNLKTSLSCAAELEKQSIFLPPHLFTAFIENAIKHSVNIHNENTFIAIHFTQTDGQLCFECENSSDPNFSTTNPKYGGLGLVNAKRRLDLLYGNNYELNISKKDLLYQVKLKIPL
ncbi:MULTISPECIES: sensor histidine kinase [Sphingobacterium]|uniref:Histidine kinase n=1 Tax=Sphingobacterium athyrii TaxID=2152717 RepID=A0A363NY81_9SPHI|nr:MULTISPECIES: histidine kinase [Sphingobacterium]PUV25776.1 histidine kinase [Sphingobacterium athyrii]